MKKISKTNRILISLLALIMFVFVAFLLLANVITTKVDSSPIKNAFSCMFHVITLGVSNSPIELSNILARVFDVILMGVNIIFFIIFFISLFTLIETKKTNKWLAFITYSFSYFIYLFVSSYVLANLIDKLYLDSSLRLNIAVFAMIVAILIILIGITIYSFSLLIAQERKEKEVIEDIEENKEESLKLIDNIKSLYTKVINKFKKEKTIQVNEETALAVEEPNKEELVEKVTPIEEKQTQEETKVQEETSTQENVQEEIQEPVEAFSQETQVQEEIHELAENSVQEEVSAQDELVQEEPCEEENESIIIQEDSTQEQEKENNIKEETNSEEDEEEESETIEIIDENGNIKTIIKKVSFATKLKKADETTRQRYNEIKGYILAYGEKDRLSFSKETFSSHREVSAILTIAGKSLKIYLPLQASNFVNSNVRLIDVSKKKKYANTPSAFRISTNLALKKCKALIDIVMSTKDTILGDVIEKDYAKETIEKDSSIQ